jgi:hypothetical protein
MPSFFFSISCTEPTAICRMFANSLQVREASSAINVAHVLIRTSVRARFGAPGPPLNAALSRPFSNCSYQRHTVARDTMLSPYVCRSAANVCSLDLPLCSRNLIA